jgi:hypothetical protein
MPDLPWVISVDDHVVEPPHVWQSWLPERYRARGPRVEQDTCETVIVPGRPGATYVRGGPGPVVDWWVYEDLLRPIPQVMACAGFPPESLTLAPLPFAEVDSESETRTAGLAHLSDGDVWTSTSDARSWPGGGQLGSARVALYGDAVEEPVPFLAGQDRSFEVGHGVGPDDAGREDPLEVTAGPVGFHAVGLGPGPSKQGAEPVVVPALRDRLEVLTQRIVRQGQAAEVTASGVRSVGETATARATPASPAVGDGAVAGDGGSGLAARAQRALHRPPVGTPDGPERSASTLS